MPYVGNMNTTFTTLTSSDANITDDLTVTDDASVGGDLTLTGSLSANGAPFTISNTSNNNNIDIKTTSSGSLVHAVKIHSGGTLEAKQGLLVGGDVTANLLDDYEEGTHNPTDSSGASLTFSTFTGAYTKIGNVVCFQAKVIYPSTSNSSEARISLPFVVGAPHANYYPSGKNDANGNTSASLTLGVTGQSYAIFKNDSGGSTATNANLSGANINIALTYKTT